MTMQNAQEEDGQLFGSIRGYLGKFLRCGAYWLVATLLLQANTYAIHSPFWLAAGIGALGLTSRSAYLGQFGIAILLLMALFPSSLVADLVNLG